MGKDLKFNGVFQLFMAIYVVTSCLLWLTGNWVFHHVIYDHKAAMGWVVPEAISDSRIYTAYLIYTPLLVVNVVVLVMSDLGYKISQWLNTRPLILLIFGSALMSWGLYYAAPILSARPSCDCYIDNPAWFLALLTVGFPILGNTVALLVKKIALSIGWFY